MSRSGSTFMSRSQGVQPLKQASYTRTYGAADEGIWVRFYIEPVEDLLASERAGRPIFRDEERIELTFPGNPYSKPVMRVTDEHRQRWPHEYAAFKAGEEFAVSGTPIEYLPGIRPSMVRELKALEVLTVEHLANLSDHGLQKIPMGGRMLQERARAYLDDADRDAILSQRDAEIQGLHNEIESLKLKMENMRMVFSQPAMVDPAERAKVGAFPGPEYPAPVVPSPVSTKSALEDIPDLPASLKRRRSRDASAEAAE